MATNPATMTETQLDVLRDWLQEIARNTAVMRDAAKGVGGAGTKKEKEEESRFDRFARRIEGAIAVGIGSRLGQAQALTNRGFSGTLEGARYDFAMEQLSRQFAAVMLPVMQALTYGASEIERRMRAMSGGEQNRLMGGIIGAGVGLRYGGAPGAIAGGLLGWGLMAPGGSDTSGLVGAASGAVLGYRAGGIYGAALGAGVGYVTERGDYGALRARGSSRGGAAAGATGLALGDYADYVLAWNPATALPYWGSRALGGEGIGDTSRRLSGVPTGDGDLLSMVRRWTAGIRGPEAHRDVTPFSPVMVGAGESHFRMQEGAIRATAGIEDDGGPLKPLIDIGLLILDELIKLGGGTPPPRTARS